MSPSSTGSWPSGPGDIIDLDRYMRGNVRPSRPLSEDSRQYERLVVDGGCKAAPSQASGDARCKRASLDSGVSDGSYRRARRHGKHRRGSYQENSTFYPPNEVCTKRASSGRPNSSNSMRAFRAVCQQALLQQQQQIARVAELCERLTERAEKTEKNELIKQNEQLTEHRQSERKPLSVDSVSDMSSSSRSTKDPRRKDTYRTDECKTYKIIMRKLDELNRLFATHPPRTPRARAQRTPSSSSVSVCDKLVATDPQRTYNRTLAPTLRRHVVSKAAPAQFARSPRHTVTQAYAVDIAPRDAKDVQTNVLTESIMKCESGSSTGSQQSACDPCCGFDLDDPVHLYSQAKRLQGSLNTRLRRARSVEQVTHDAQAREHAREHACQHAGAPSLCAVCRSYWRYLRHCVPVLARVVDSCKCS